MVDPSIPIGGSVSGSILKSRAAIRFALGPKVQPASIFGVGDRHARSRLARLDGELVRRLAAGAVRRRQAGGFRLRARTLPERRHGIPFRGGGRALSPHGRPTAGARRPAGAPFEVPGEKGGIDLWNPQGMALVKANAAEVGKANAQNPLIVSYQMDNERRFPFSHGLCPTAAADVSFRQWCHRWHGELATLNRRWGTAYKSWDEVEQPASARYAEEVKKRPKPQGAAAIDWTASLGKLTPEIQRRMLAIPGRGMDWMRWRTASSLWAYDAFHESARQFDRKTLYSSNLCWPNFAPQMSMPFFRHMDATMLDVQYTAGSGLPRGLGTPMEMMEIIEMAESNAPEKPLWGIEIYQQPQWPAEFAALQNWGLLAHGMRNTLVFGWGPVLRLRHPQGAPGVGETRRQADVDDDRSGREEAAQLLHQPAFAAGDRRSSTSGTTPSRCGGRRPIRPSSFPATRPSTAAWSRPIGPGCRRGFGRAATSVTCCG